MRIHADNMKRVLHENERMRRELPIFGPSFKKCEGKEIPTCEETGCSKIAFKSDGKKWLCKGHFHRACFGPQWKSEKVGRNTPCPCGSGRKYKHCCISKEKS